jgi:hypothetical protein
MKKKTTVVNQPNKVEANKSGLLTSLAPVQKMYRDHTSFDHFHGRVNKFSFGSDHGPIAF